MTYDTQHTGQPPPNGGEDWPCHLGRDGDGSFHPARNGDGPLPPFDTWSLLEPVLLNWRRLLAASGVLALLGFGFATWRWDATYTANAQLIRHESPNSEEVFRPRQVQPQTFALLLRSPELVQRAAEKTDPPVAPASLARRVRVTAERNSDLISVSVAGSDPDIARSLANLYAAEAVEFTREIEAAAAAEVEAYLARQLEAVEDKLHLLNEQWLAQPVMESAATSGQPVTPAHVLWRPTALMAKRQTAREELADLLTRYTDAHPLVQQQREKLAAIDRQLRTREPDPGEGQSHEVAAPVPTALRGAIPPATDPEVLRTQLQLLENARLSLASRQRAAQLFQHDAPGYFRLFSPATPDSVQASTPGIKTAAVTMLGAVGGGVMMTLFVLWGELKEPRLKTARDVSRVTGLPVVAAMLDLHTLEPKAREQSAFRAWTALQNRLSLSPNHGLICGITSVRHGEGRSTWVRLLAEAAQQRGFRVLTVATRPSPPTDLDPPSAPGDGPNGDSPPPASTALTTNVLATPAQVAAQLTGPDPQPVVHIPLPGWVWNLERRKQWQAALNEWRRIDNLVILVELPPASVPETVLLAENVPNLVWLTDSGSADAIETREELQTLRLSRCHLVGAVLNRAPRTPWSDCFPRWTGHQQHLAC
jgi:capsular polysaccharide biosynthesis protein